MEGTNYFKENGISDERAKEMIERLQQKYKKSVITCSLICITWCIPNNSYIGRVLFRYLFTKKRAGITTDFINCILLIS